MARANGEKLRHQYKRHQQHMCKRRTHARMAHANLILAGVGLIILYSSSLGGILGGAGSTIFLTLVLFNVALATMHLKRGLELGLRIRH